MWRETRTRYSPDTQAVTWKQLGSYGHTGSWRRSPQQQRARARARRARRDATRWTDSPGRGERSIITTKLRTLPFFLCVRSVLRTANGVATLLPRSFSTYHDLARFSDLRSRRRRVRSLWEDKDHSRAHADNFRESRVIHTKFTADSLNITLFFLSRWWEILLCDVLQFMHSRSTCLRGIKTWFPNAPYMCGYF